MTQQPNLPPASQKLLRELARRDNGEGVAVRYSARGRWYFAGPTTSLLFNTRTFPPLYEAGLATGWDEHDDDGPMRITEAGRKLAAELEQQDAEQQAARGARPKPNPNGAAARRLLREIAKHDDEMSIYSDSRGPRVWRLGGRDGYSASVGTWLALSGADLIHVEYGFSGGKRVTVTDAGRQRLATRTR